MVPPPATAPADPLRLYFDNNVYNRPFDDRAISRNRVEARAVEELVVRIENEEAELVSSFVVEAEHSRLAIPARRREVRRLMDLAQAYVAAHPVILERARGFRGVGLYTNDALHLAVAEYAEVDYFVTCDDKLLRKARSVEITVRVVLPTELLEEESS